MTDTFDIDGAIVTNCIIEYIGDSFPDTTDANQPVDNVGTGGSDYDGTASLGWYSEYGIGPSGAKRWKFTTGTYDYISFPSGALTDNLSQMTFEIAFVTDNAFQSVGSLANKCNSAWSAGWTFLINASSGGLMLYKATTDGYIFYTTTGADLEQGHTYFVQVTWDFSSTSNSPICVISKDGAAATTYTYPASMTLQYSGSNTAWAVESGETGYIDADHNHVGYQSCITLYAFRLHNKILSSQELTTNRNASKWRIESVKDVDWTQTTVPTGTADKATPTVSSSSAWTQTTLIGGTADKATPTIETDTSFTQTVVPTGTADKATPTIETDSSFTQTVVPTGTADKATPTVSSSSAWAQTTVPSGVTATAALSKVVDTAYIQTIHPDGISEIYAVTASTIPQLDVSFIQTVVPDGVSSIYAVYTEIGAQVFDITIIMEPEIVGEAMMAETEVSAVAEAVSPVSVILKEDSAIIVEV